MQKRGYALFRNYGCVSCHQGSNIGGNMFQIFGVFGSGDDRAQVSPEDKPARSPHASLADLANDRNVYRVPSLRNVAVTPPYFHDGSAPTLEEAVKAHAYVDTGRKRGSVVLTVAHGPLAAAGAF